MDKLHSFDSIKNAGDLMKRFDISKYDSTSVFTPTAWAKSIGIRLILRASIPKSITVGSEDCGKFLIFLDVLSQMLDDPLSNSTKKRAPVWLCDSLYSSVMDHPLERCYELVDTLNMSATLVKQSLNSERADYKLESDWEPEIASIDVDMCATDVRILQDFKKWLAEKRRMRELKEGHKIPRVFTKADFEQWHRQKILAYFDLQMLANYLTISLSQNQIGQVLFPDEVDIDTTERIRKVVKPLVKRIFNVILLEALDRQVCADYEPFPEDFASENSSGKEVN